MADELGGPIPGSVEIFTELTEVVTVVHWPGISSTQDQRSQPGEGRHAAPFTQAIQAIGQVLEMLQRQGAHQQERMQPNTSLFKMPWMTKDDAPAAYIEAFK